MSDDTNLNDLPEEAVEKLIKDAIERMNEGNGKDEGYKESSGDAPDKKSGDSGESPKNAKPNSDIPQHLQNDKKYGKLLLHDSIEGDDGRKVTIDVYDTESQNELVMDGKIIRYRNIRFVLKYKNIVKECIGVDCRNVVKEISRATNYSPSSKEILEKVAELRAQYESPEEIPIVDYVKQKYPDRLEEIEKDPFQWILQRTNNIVGYDRLKILTFLAVISSQMKRLEGISRLNIMLTGKSGSGKSSTVNAVLNYVSEDILIDVVRMTQNSLGYLDVDTLDGKILFINQIDKQNISYIRDMITEGKLCTLVTRKVVDEEGNERFKAEKVCIPGKAVVITTSVADNVDIEREQLNNRILRVYVNQDEVDRRKLRHVIWKRSGNEPNEVDRLVFMAYLLSRPKDVITDPTEDLADKFLAPIEDFVNRPLPRVTEVLRNLTITVAIARGKTKTDEEDFKFVMDNFQLDVLYNGLELTENDVVVIRLLPNDAGLKTNDIAYKLRASKQYTLSLLRNLESKAIVEPVRMDEKSNSLTWYLTDLGIRIKSFITNVNVVRSPEEKKSIIDGVVEVRDEEGRLQGVVDRKFRPNTDAGGDRKDAVSGDDAGKVPGGKQADDRVVKAYEFLKQRGAMPISELTMVFGDDIIEQLKKNDRVTFQILDGVEYAYPK